MNPLLSKVLDAYGGLDRWNDFATVSATLVTGGSLWALKGLETDDTPRRMTTDLHRQWSSITPFGDPEWLSDFVPGHVAIKTRDGKTIAERENPRQSFDGHGLTSHWDPLQRAYFNGYAMWTYMTTPFVFAEPGYDLLDIAPLNYGDEEWRGLRVTFPEGVASHSRQQDFYFGPDGLLRRHDYHVDVSGGFAAAHLVSDFVDVKGLRFPTKRRAYNRGEDLQPKLDELLVSIDISGYELR